MNPWRKYPFIRILVPFMIGIILSMKFHNENSVELMWWLIPILICFLIGMVIHRRITYGNKSVFGVALMLGIFFAGYLWSLVFNLSLGSNHYRTLLNDTEYMVCQLSSDPIEKERSYQAFAKVVEVIDSNRKHYPANGKILLYFEKCDTLKHFHYHDKLVLPSRSVAEIKQAMNPSGFDYKRYLALRGVFYSVYLEKESYLLQPNTAFSLKAVAGKVRRTLIRILQQSSLSGDEFALVNALVLGYDQFLNQDIKLSYSNAGAMHILCVSGLHVGIIYMVISFLMTVIPGVRKLHKRWQVLLIMLFIWIYAFITGLEPAVMRASVMFTLVAIGKSMHRKSRIYNTLAASAFIMLVINPNMLSYVGFQLSYLAVFGIVWLQPYIVSWWYPKCRLLRYFWELIAVSLAAQIILFPLLIYYFHKLSLLFFITNLFAIPGAALIIYITLLYFVLSWIPGLSVVIAFALQHVVWLMNFLIDRVSHLPYAYVEHIWLEQWIIIILYVAMIVSIIFVIRHKKYSILSGVVLVIILFVTLFSVKFKKARNNRFVLYHINNGLAMDFMQKDKSVFLADSTVINNNRTISFQIENYWYDRYVMPQPICRDTVNRFSNQWVFYHDPFIMFNGDIFFLTDKIPEIHPQKPIIVDYLLLTGWIDVKKDRIREVFKIRKAVVITTKSPRYRASEYESILVGEGYRVINTYRDGAFVINYEELWY